ncbi:MAG: STAS domain-containing protein [Candidatus Sumerlaeia bacterium]|nr:STAS domain-containing protein [Candidatus Sumerlaeia bacterium]
MKTFEVENRALDSAAGVVVVGLSGYLDAHTVADFDKHTDDLLGAGTNKIVLDLQGLSYISSAGIGALMGLSQRLKKHGGDLVLLQPTAKVYKILDLLGFTRIFHLCTSEDEARAVFQS